MEFFVDFLKLLVIVLLVGAISLVITINVSPQLTVSLLRYSFDKEATKPKEYKTYAQQVKILQNIKYKSKYKNSKLDIYTRAENKNRPTIIWAHGGAFVAGDKADVKYWATKMAYYGYNVVSINYSLSPDNHYPDQIKQMNDAIKYVVANYSSKLNVKDVVIGGDSAGAHIASQLIAAQSNRQLAQKIGYEPIDTIKIVGGLLYCGPYDIAQITKQQNQSFLTKFFVNQLGWAYLGKKNWQATRMSKYVSTVKYVNSKFPPIFITDGNSGSFEAQGKELYKQLQKKNVTVKKLFFDKSQKIGHEYQFNLDSSAAKKCFKETISFLNDLENR